ncbi:MAG: DUF4145 domain-containing protein [Pyrinomonadaceae bacterium]|nr:DUF4145 domain-containing protein [Pyrinomonadaceae bacterium]
MKTIEIKPDGDLFANYRIYLFGVPEDCPRCGKWLFLGETGFSRDRLPGSSLQQTVFHLSYCVNEACGHFFLSEYRLRLEPGNLRHYDFHEVNIAVPAAPRDIRVSSDIARISPRFLEIYKQAMASEYLGLEQLTGIGLRKALEFLIKDYALSLNPERRDAIFNQSLADCIATYVTDLNLRECAKRAVWLGNDETHYTRRWKDRDIEDLKTLITLTLVWLDNALRTAEYLKSMNRERAGQLP